MSVEERHEACAAAFAADAQRGVVTLADELIALADHLKCLAAGFESENRSLTGLAADIVSDYTSRTGNGSARLWIVVYNAGKAEWHRARIFSSREDES